MLKRYSASRPVRKHDRNEGSSVFLNKSEKWGKKGIDSGGPFGSISPQMKEKDQLNKVVKVRLTRAQFRLLADLAKTTGIKIGTLARIAIVTYLSK